MLIYFKYFKICYLFYLVLVKKKHCFAHEFQNVTSIPPNFESYANFAPIISFGRKNSHDNSDGAHDNEIKGF